MADRLQSNNPHELRSFQTHLRDKIRTTSFQYGERNFLGDHMHNTAGAANGGALQGRRYAGISSANTTVAN
jgi:hypothetical protein